jgi:hypothetical protein
MATIPYNLDIELPSGDDRTLPITIRNSDGVTDADYSSWTVFFTVKTSRDQYLNDSEAVYQLKSTDPSSRITVSASGTPLVTNISIDHFARATSDSTGTPLEPGVYYYDIQLVSPSGVVQTWFNGVYRVTWHSTVSVN